MFNEQSINTRTYDALGFEFEPLGVIRLKLWRIKERQEGDAWVFDSYEVRALDRIITDALKVNPETLVIAPDDDPAGVPAFSYVYSQFPQLKALAETYVQVNGLAA